MAPHKFSVRSTAEARTSGRDIAATSRRLRHSNSSFTVSARGLPMSKSLLFAVIAAFLLLGLPILAGDRLPVALAQIAVSFTEWTVPTKGSHPHDPLAAADGSIWYTGQMASTLGRLDPETGVFKEYHTSIPNSGPHGLVADQDGNIWFTASFAGYIGKLDPNTGAISEYRLPDNAHDPHTPVFDRSGNLWFTVIGANAIGRLVPRTGEIKIVHVPTKNALPYGIAVNADGVPYFAEFGTNKIASINPQTMAISEYPLPDAASRPRRIAIATDGAIWYTDFASGFLGRLDPKTGSARDWPSPSGPGSGPYGITAVGDVIWYSESGVSPNTLARFDPQRQKIEIWPIPSGGGVAQHDGDARRQARSCVQRRRPHRPGRCTVTCASAGKSGGQRRAGEGNRRHERRAEGAERSVRPQPSRQRPRCDVEPASIQEAVGRWRRLGVERVPAIQQGDLADAQRGRRNDPVGRHRRGRRLWRSRRQAVGVCRAGAIPVAQSLSRHGHLASIREGQRASRERSR
jgi:streptogramin lyase